MIEVPSQEKAPPIYDNSLYRRLIVRPLGARLAPSLHTLGFSPNGVCWLKLIFGLAGAFLLASKSSFVCFIGMMMLQMNFLLDAADGEVARLSGKAGKLSGEYLDKLFDHLPKTAMYFFWGYGTFRLTGSHIPLFCGTFFAAWNIFPRFCGVETLLERLDKAPAVYEKPAFHRALSNSFVVERDRGKADFYLTMFVHPVMNLLSIFYLIEIFLPQFHWMDHAYDTRYALLFVFTLIGMLNFIRKSVKFFRSLEFS